MKYKKCPRCEINYVTVEKTFCDVCLAEMHGESFCEEVSFDVCPFCEKRFLQNGEEMCQSCLSRKQKRMQKDDE